MSPEFFRQQWERLKIRFGQKALDDEFKRLVAQEMRGMSEHGFLRLVDVMVGNRPASKPPLLSDFREARLKEEKTRFDNEVKAADRGMNTPWQGGLQAVLSKYYPGCKTPSEAVEVEKLRIQVARANGEPDPGPVDGGAA